MEDVTIGVVLLWIPLVGLTVAFTCGMAFAITEFTYETVRRFLDRKFFK